MEIKDLRIGNLVLRNNTDIRAVQSVSPFGCNLDADGESGFDTNFSNVFPIPLTEEWLLMFGFTKCELLNLYASPHLGFYSLAFDLNGQYYTPYETDNVIDFKLKYIHQLQNIFFAFTDEELIKPNR